MFKIEKNRFVINFHLFGIAMISPCYAEENSSSISLDTVITENNIYEVLEYLGLDSSAYIKNKTTEGIKTVGELKREILKFRSTPKVIYDNSNTKNTARLYPNKAYSSGTVTLYTISDVSSFVVKYVVNAKYSNNNYTGISGLSWYVLV